MKNDRLIPYAVIIAAKKGDPDAMRQILQHYDPYKLPDGETLGE